MDPLRASILWASGNATLRERLPRYRFVRATVRTFMPGETMPEALEAAGRLADEGLATSFTLLGEHITDRAQAESATAAYLRLLDRIEELGLDGEPSVKLTQLGYDEDREHTAKQIARLAERSAELGKTLWLDMESSGYVAPTVDLYEELLRDGHDVGLCLQAYLKRTWDDVQRLLPHGPAIRLVKGAYREPPAVAFADRRTIDEAYRRLAGHLAGDPRVRRTVLGTHDTELVERIARELDARDRFEVAMLYGIRTDEQRRLAREGYAVRILIAYGSHWYPWFMRRIAEKPVANTLLAVRNLA